MVTDFNGFDKGVIGKKLPSDSTLNNMKKAELIELLHIAEHNHTVLAQFYKNAVDNSKCHRCTLVNTRNKLIDDFAEKLCNECYEKSEKAVLDGSIMMDIVTLDCVNDLIMEISEQLKEGILSEQINKQ